LNTAIAKISYKQDGINFNREVFVSYPAQAVVVRFTSDKPGQLSFSCNMDRPERYKTYAEQDQLIMKGTLLNGKRGEGMNYNVRLKAINSGGTVSYNKDNITIEKPMK